MIGYENSPAENCLISSIHFVWDSALSHDNAIILTPRSANFAEYDWALASSVVHTGVKSAGCEKSIAHLMKKILEYFRTKFHCKAFFSTDNTTSFMILLLIFRVTPPVPIRGQESPVTFQAWGKLFRKREILTRTNITSAHFKPIFHSYTTWKRQKAIGFQGVQNNHVKLYLLVNKK